MCFMKKKVFVLLPSLAGGGAERVMLTVLKNLDKNKFDTKLLLFQATGEYIDLVDKVSIVDLKIGQGFIKKLGFVKLIKYLHDDTPDILISSMVGVNTICSTIKPFFPSSMKLVVRETGIMSKRVNLHPIYKWLTKVSLNNSDRIIAQSNDMSSDLHQNYNVDLSKLIKIQNPIDYELIVGKLNCKESINLKKDKFNLVSIGRFSFQKGYDLLLKAFSEISGNNNYHLTIIGKGEGKKVYEDFICKNSLEERVTLIDFTDNPFLYLKNADLFVSSSRWEGFPNVVLESLVCGTPVLSHDYLGGVNEIIINKFNGFICDITNHREFENTLDQATKVNWNEAEIISHALHKWDKKIIIQEYNDFLQNL